MKKATKDLLCLKCDTNLGSIDKTNTGVSDSLPEEWKNINLIGFHVGDVAYPQIPIEEAEPRLQEEPFVLICPKCKTIHQLTMIDGKVFLVIPRLASPHWIEEIEDAE